MNTHPVIPPPGLVNQWLDNDHFPMVTGTRDLMSITKDRLDSVATQAAQWGSDQELEACCQWLFENDYDVAPVCLRTARRTKPPSLKERLSKAIIDGDEREALKLLEELDDSL